MSVCPEILGITDTTLLLILGGHGRRPDQGWEPGQSARMRRRYQRLTDRVLKDTGAGSDEATTDPN